MSVGELKKRLEDFDDDKTVFIKDEIAVEAFVAMRTAGFEENCVILLSKEQTEKLAGIKLSYQTVY